MLIFAWVLFILATTLIIAGLGYCAQEKDFLPLGVLAVPALVLFAIGTMAWTDHQNHVKLSNNLEMAYKIDVAAIQEISDGPDVIEYYDGELVCSAQLIYTTDTFAEINKDTITCLNELK